MQSSLIANNQTYPKRVDLTHRSIAQIEWSQAALSLFQKIASLDPLETIQEFQADVERIFSSISLALQVKIPGCNLLSQHHQLIDRQISKTYQIVMNKKEKNPIDAVNWLVQSQIFQAMNPFTNEFLKKDNDDNYSFFKERLSPYRLLKTPALQFQPPVLEWFTLMTLAVTTRPAQDKLSILKTLPLPIYSHVMVSRERIGMQMLSTFIKSDGEILLRLFNREPVPGMDIKIAKVWNEYLQLFQEAKDKEGDYSKIVYESIHAVLPNLISKLPDESTQPKVGIQSTTTYFQGIITCLTICCIAIAFFNYLQSSTLE